MPARISIRLESGGLFRFEGRLRAIERNTSPAAFAEASAEMMKALEVYTKSRWGAGVHVTQTTLDRWPDWQPLYRTGELKRSLTEAGSHGAIRELTPYGFKWGTSVFYVRFLAKGTRKMQRKPVIGGNVDTLRAYRAVTGYAMRKYVMRGVMMI